MTSIKGYPFWHCVFPKLLFFGAGAGLFSFLKELDQGEPNDRGSLRAQECYPLASLVKVEAPGERRVHWPRQSKRKHFDRTPAGGLIGFEIYGMTAREIRDDCGLDRPPR